MWIFFFFFWWLLEPRGQCWGVCAGGPGRAQTGNVRYNSSGCAEVQPGYFSWNMWVCQEFLQGCSAAEWKRAQEKKKRQKFAFKEKSESERQCPYWQCCPERVRLGLSAFEGSASHFHSELVPLTQRSHPGLSKQSQLAAEMSLVLALPKLV